MILFFTEIQTIITLIRDVILLFTFFNLIVLSVTAAW